LVRVYQQGFRYIWLISHPISYKVVTYSRW
jgi:hypothetical protein